MAIRRPIPWWQCGIPLAFRDFRLFLVARLCSTVAQSMMVIAVGWQVYDIARRTMPPRQAALQLGFVGALQFLPLFILALFAGWLADRIDRRLITRACTALQLLCAVALTWFASRAAMTLAPLFAVAVAFGVARALSAPALGALGANLLPKEVLPRGIAVGTIATRVGSIAGPTAGGYLYAGAPHLPYIASTTLLAVSLGCALLIRPFAATPLAARDPWRQMIEGLHYVRHNRLVLGAISLDLFAVLLGGATALLPVFARDILHVGPSGLGHLRAAPSAGGIVTAIWFSWRPLRRRVGIKMLAAVALFGVATIGFGLSRWLPLSLLCLAILGAADMLSVYVRQSLIQLSTPDDMRGRVGAVSSLFISASNELGEAESSFLAALLGPVVAVVAGGAGAIAITLLWAKWFPVLRNADGFDHVASVDPRLAAQGEAGMLVPEQIA